MANNENMLPVGTLLHGGVYQVTKQLSNGGFGNTYIIRHICFDEYYAMKEFFMKGVNTREGDFVTVSVPDNKATFEQQKEKLKKEARRLRQLHNTHIVHVHDLFEERGTVYYVMDYIEGESLADKLQREQKPFTEKETLDILKQLLDALIVVHGQSPQILHLDIKPANIMIDGNGHVYLIDFGASKQLADNENQTLSTSTGMSYTAGYAPIEQIEQNFDRIGPWSDYYALGATLYKLLTKNQPPTPSEISEDAEDAFSFPASISAKTQQLISWLMAPNRRKRPQNVEEIRKFMNETEIIATNKGNTKPIAPIEEETVFVLDSKPTNNTSQTTEETTTFLDDKANKNKLEENKRIWKAFYVIALIVILLIVVFKYLGKGGSTNTKTISVPKSSEVRINKPNDLIKQAKEDKDSIIQNLINNMIEVKGGTFTMGPDGDKSDELFYHQAHKETVGTFKIGKYEVTIGEWIAVMGDSLIKSRKFLDGYFFEEIINGKTSLQHPMGGISWYESYHFICQLNKITGKKFRFLKEKEWEYAARGGRKSHGTKYAGSNNIDEVAWYRGNSMNDTHAVGLKKPNELGIYDMTGNVNEWVLECLWFYDVGPERITAEYFKEKKNTSTEYDRLNNRLYRGGSYDDDEDLGDLEITRRTERNVDFYNGRLGLRIAM